LLKYKLIAVAGKLSEVIDSLDQSQPLLREAYTVLRPIVNRALAGQLPIPGQLPQQNLLLRHVRRLAPG
jgi:hypothetical protein